MNDCGHLRVYHAKGMPEGEFEESRSGECPFCRIRELEAEADRNYKALTGVIGERTELQARIRALEADLAIVTKDRNSLLDRIETTVGVVAAQLHAKRTASETSAQRDSKHE